MSKNFNPALGDFDKFIEEHSGLVKHIVNKGFRTKLKYLQAETSDDLLQIGYIGLIHAYNRYDPNKNTKFSSFAYSTIRGFIAKYLRDTSSYASGIKFSSATNEIFFKLQKMEDAEITVDFVKEKFGCGERLAKRVIERSWFQRLDDVNVRLGEDEEGERLGSLIERIADEADYSVVHVSEFMNYLSDFERSVLKLRMEEKTQEEIARQLGVYQMKISRALETIAKKYLYNQKEVIQ
ncbi:RNA polymerase sigma factor [Bacillus phage SP-10]|uniref:RNA polymerase sigma factor n=1 Tax=Bacillus phage SP10 TaxID=941058 RepID=UPI0002198B4C|nr:RNA polymerase sigma factor [Bacillus phage SP-10]BAK52932.1 RNA polymerase sigma factor [Bacillus phage SP-10]